MPQPKGVGVLAPRLNPPHAEKTLQSSLKSPDRLLGSVREQVNRVVSDFVSGQDSLGYLEAILFWCD